MRSIRIGLAALLAAGALAGATAAAGAQQITVTATDDPASSTHCPPVDGVFGPEPCTLRAAIAQNALDDGFDTIVLPPGTYTFSHPFQIQDPVTITGQGTPGDTLIDAAGQPGAFVLTPLAAQEPITLSHLTVRGVNGGSAIISNGAEPLTLDDAVVRDNTTAPTGFGGGLQVNGGTVSILRSVFASNATVGVNGSGGAAIAIQAGDITLRDSEMRDNHAAPGTQGQGGAFWDNSSGALTIDRSRLTGNAANVGAVLYVNAGTPKVAIADSTVDGNMSTSGSALEADDEEPVSIVATGDTFLGNGRPADATGATFATGSTLTLRNTVVASAGPACFGTLRLPKSLGHNVIDDASCGLTDASDRQGIDPRLGPLAANGGPTFTALPLPDSPLLDEADPAGCSATDQRGVARPQGAGCDVGAVERSVGAPAVTTGGANGLAVSGTIDPGGHSTSVTIEYGRTTTYGNTLQLSAVSGWVARSVGATLKGVAPHALVHYRLVAANASGHAVGADRILRAPGVAVSGLRVSPHTVHAKATLRWRLSKASKVRFTVKIKRGKHGVTKARFTLKGKAGNNRHGFPAAILRHLPAGGYRLEAVALAKPALKPVHATFRYAPTRPHR